MAKLLSFMLFALLPLSAVAGSYWNHNGSIMYLQAKGNQRVMIYDEPTARMQRAGVRSGTIYFNGIRRGNRYHGTARVFSKDCIYPLEYAVVGQVVTETRIVLKGTRPSYSSGCRPNGRTTMDTLVFDYLHSD